MKPCDCYYGEDCTKTTVCANESVVQDLGERIAELEAEVKALWLEKIERDNVADREVENEPHPDHCLCDDCVTLENMEERLEISRKFMEQANSEVENNE